MDVLSLSLSGQYSGRDPRCYAHNGRPLPNNKVLVSVNAMLPLGQQQSLDYTNNRLVLCKTPITAPISKNSFILPGNVASSASAFLKTMTERKDRRLMLHVKSVVQFREEEVRKALEFMPGSVPPTFTHNNRLFQSPKSVLLRRFKSPTSPFYYHEATPSSSTTTSTPLSITASTSTSTQLIVD